MRQLASEVLFHRQSLNSDKIGLLASTMVADFLLLLLQLHSHNICLDYMVSPMRLLGDLGVIVQRDNIKHLLYGGFKCSINILNSFCFWDVIL
jgi:hypothetical protein